ncbi:Clan CD, family C14, metacaspase-like cysteine peptidase [Trichomonas vaginalis G3]|uniref:Clan CD, family C14, metacaspase-like cysteine peptidase n=1 Tax=Trichomonas vaginalis (strain ATCC PRA-98 / G3) TaxID=412133 RepID=A2DUX1_TRIV3|nr:cysteine-type peptidase protein [Trichomonas vaginalis G3]EAY15856.1 Clan CD, family C14, metacaspase-like cysteine peptidase [Trichomonas vaginalis G3]KAI5524975.1 cysteine-type peptidase protein [Trichomonas vaginalis G3]|eukprot:XP_001328079.1 Clan CD, family C14, metacaspase-like cysteine peptidase [Trichomonas vaginalis G3]
MSSKKNIKKYGTDITNIGVNRIPTNLNRVGFVVINCYIGTRYSLGDGPMNDGYNMAKCLKRYGFQVFYIYDQKRNAFMEKLKFFLENVKRELVVYYVGHGTSVADTDGDEDDQMDEAFVFVDGNVIDDELVECVSNSKNTESKVVFVSDCCHSGSIWDLQGGDVNGRKLPDKLVSVSAANDKQTAKQTVAERMEQGMFTYNLMKTLKADPDMTAVECKKRLATALRRYAQTVTIASTTPELLNEPLFLNQ